MPIQFQSQEFTDIFGNVLPFYQSNAGDKTTAKFTLRSTIRISSVGNPLIFDSVQNQITSTVFSWLDEGFRVGGWVWIRKYNSQSNVILNWWTQINLITPDGSVCDFDTLQTAGINIQNNESMVFLAVTGDGITVARSRDDLDVLLNHVVNNGSGSSQSLIDGEDTRMVFAGLAAMVVGQSILGVFVSDQSGQFAESSQIERLANANDSDTSTIHELTLVFINSGGYDPAWFASGNCLKLFIRLLWSSFSGEPYARATVTYNLDANTGQFNQAHNTSLADSSLIQGFGGIDYCFGQLGVEIIVTGPLVDIGIGCMYVPEDEAYYKNRPFPQQNITMTLATRPATLGIHESEANEFGATYSLQIINISNVGPVTTLIFNIFGNQEFIDFMEGRELGDRLFKIWVKCGNANLLAFSNQLTCDPVLSGPLPMVQDYGYLDHSQNTTVATGDLIGFVADTEDDVAYVGRFLLTKGEEFSRFNVRLEAFNTVTEEDFTLQLRGFSFSGVQVSNDGRYLLNESGTSTTQLLQTNVKRQFLLILDPSLDVGNQYGVKIYAPWLLNWKNWIIKNDANVDFYPTQNENWEQYSGFTDWVVRTELQLIQDNFAFVHTNELSILPYNSEDDIEGLGIELIIEATQQVVEVAPENTLMRIRVTRDRLVGGWDALLTYVQITVEPKESAPRWDCSSVVPFDNNSQNPLTPESGNLIVVNYPIPSRAIFECLFDTSKIDVSNGISITGKIKGPERIISDRILTAKGEARLGLSVRKISTDFVYSDASPCMKVRRSSDNSELDIGFTGSPLALNVGAPTTVGSLLWHVTNNNTEPLNDGFVTVWYGQDGEARNATQTTLSMQPKIVGLGLVLTDSAGIPSILFDGIDDYFELLSTVFTTQLFYQSFVFNRKTTGIHSIGAGSDSGAPAPVFWFSNDDVYSGMTTLIIHDVASVLTGQFIMTTLRDNIDDLKMWRSGLGLTTLTSVNSLNDIRTIGRRTNTYHSGPMQEIIYYDNDQEANRAFIEGNTTDYYTGI